MRYLLTRVGNYINAINEPLAFLERDARLCVFDGRGSVGTRRSRADSSPPASSSCVKQPAGRAPCVHIYFRYKCINVLPAALHFSLRSSRSVYFALSPHQSTIDWQDEIRICNLAVQEAGLLLHETQGYSSVE